MKVRTNEEELDLLADLLEPIAQIFADPDMARVFDSDDKPVVKIRAVIKNHKPEIIEILARIDDVPVEQYHVSAFTLPLKVLALLKKPEVQELFTGQVLKSGADFSGPAMANTEDGAR